MVLIMEITLRAFFSLSYDYSFFDQGKLVYKYYPELRPVFEKGTDAQGDSTTVLVLGGSVVNENFCNFDSLLNKVRVNEVEPRPYKVFMLAQYAQNSMDSWNKYQLLKDYPFDLVIFYHGINDTRTNNAPEKVFDPDYRHVSFYNEFYVFKRHPEIQFTMLPWFFDYLWQKILEGTGLKEMIPKEYNIMEYFKEKKILDRKWWEHGSDVKSRHVFRKNLEQVISLSKTKGDRLVLLTYASHLPDNYSVDLFASDALDYSHTHLKSWPVEIYGDPEHVSKGISIHNSITRQTARDEQQLVFIDFDHILPKEGKYFYDICHLTPTGCVQMGTAIQRRLAGE